MRTEGIEDRAQRTSALLTNLAKEASACKDAELTFMTDVIISVTALAVTGVNLRLYKNRTTEGSGK